MSCLILVPSQLEMDRLLPQGAQPLDAALPAWQGEQCKWALCGVGAAAATLATTHFIRQFQPSRVVLVGIAGAFAQSGLEPDQVVQAHKETFSDLGYHDEHTYYNLDQLKLAVLPSQPQALGCSYPLSLLDPGEQAWSFITNSLITNSEVTAGRLWHTYGAALENMEGAAVAMACAFHRVTCHEVRAVSNRVGPRNPKLWRVKESLEALSLWLSKRTDLLN